ncbi:Ig domain-containing protein [Patescibacteria group bacterium]|nr:Ig domain-containing protein [Patescibacteria group bacterium]
MKNKYLLLILGILIIFSVNSLSAIVVHGNWENGNQFIEINDGENIGFNVNFYSMSPPMVINIKLYDSDYNLIYTFQNNHVVNDYGYFNTFNLGKSIYNSPGSYRVILQGSDNYPSADNYILHILVNPVIIPPETLKIISNPITQVDEGVIYNYQVIADGGILPYQFSLINAPNWLSINSQTGLITGRAPFVDGDTAFQIRLKVQDEAGDSVFQDYVLSVKNIIPPPEQEDPISPGTGSGVRFIPIDEYYFSRWINQFRSISPSDQSDEEGRIPLKSSEGIKLEEIVVWLMMLIILLLILLIVTYLIKDKTRKKNK